MRSETSVVLAMARGDPSPESTLTIRWSRVKELARQHQVDALCYRALRTGGEPGSAVYGAVPDGVKRSFRHAYLNHLVRNEALLRDMAFIETCLAARGIAALYLKGPWLAMVGYPDPATRPVGDIDLLIREQDYRGAVEALGACGYAPAAPIPDAAEAALIRAQYGRQLRFVARDRRPVELHMRLINMGPPSVGEVWVWATARCFTASGAEFMAPGPEAMLLHLLLHANQHAFAVLRLLHDVRWALLHDQARLDRERLLWQVQRMRCRTSCYFALLLSQQLAGAPPDDLMNRLKPSRSSRIRFETIWRLKHARRLVAARRRMELESPMFYLLELGSLWDKTRYLRGVVSEAGGLGPFIGRASRLLLERSSGQGLSS